MRSLVRGFIPICFNSPHYYQKRAYQVYSVHFVESGLFVVVTGEAIIFGNIRKLSNALGREGST